MAVCFLVLSSLRHRSWTFSDSAGEASWRSRSFCNTRVWLDGQRFGPGMGARNPGVSASRPRTLMLPSMSFLTGEKATEPRASSWLQLAAVLSSQLAPMPEMQSH